MTLNINANIEITEDQVREVIVQAIKEKYGIEVTVDRLLTQYHSNYDDRQFGGYRIQFNDVEAGTILKR